MTEPANPMFTRDAITETYLGDGLYASFDGFQITLRAPRERGDHFVCLDGHVLGVFEKYVKTLRGDVDAGGDIVG